MKKKGDIVFWTTGTIFFIVIEIIIFYALIMFIKTIVNGPDITNRELYGGIIFTSILAFAVFNIIPSMIFSGINEIKKIRL